MMLCDISRTLSPSTATWPGDVDVTWSWTTRIEDGASVNLGAMQASMHAGTHVDAPLHYKAHGAPVDALPLSVFVGPVQVIDVEGEEAVMPAHVEALQAPRVLFRTSQSASPDSEWDEVFPAITADAVQAMAAQDVVLIGTDAPSVDPVDSTALHAHHALGDAGIVNLENLRLSAVKPGLYTLVALPLRLEGADAAPVRAVLMKAGALS